MLTKILKAIFGSKSSRDVKRLLPKVKRVNELEAEYQKLSDDQLKAKTAEFQELFFPLGYGYNLLYRTQL